jgi:hypothetical protein
MRQLRRIAADYETACRRDFLDGQVPDAIVRQFQRIVSQQDADAARLAFANTEPVAFGAQWVCSFANNAHIRQM